MMNKPDYFPTLVLVMLVAGAMATVETCYLGGAGVGVAHAQDAKPQSQQQAIENLEELLGQYDQGEYAYGNQTQQQAIENLAAAQARITELEAEVERLKHQHALLVSEYTTLKARCDGE